MISVMCKLIAKYPFGVREGRGKDIRNIDKAQIKVLPKVKVLRHTERKGLIHSRINGAKNANTKISF
jgi:hypothetical protein